MDAKIENIRAYLARVIFWRMLELSRRTVRRKVVQALYELEFQPDGIDRIINEQTKALSTADFNFFRQLITGIQQERKAVDHIISKYLKSGWTIERISTTERSILRLAVYELVYQKEAPPKVIINEAVELAKQFGDLHSRRFINGVLGKLIRETSERDNEKN